MAEIVLLHGIAQEQKSADTLESEWLPALAGGLRVAGHQELADEVWRSARPGRREVRMAFYGDLFLRRGTQGAAADLADLDGDQQELAETLALEWLRSAADRAGRPDDRLEAQRALYGIERAGTGEAQGARALLRPALNGLTRLRWFAPLGMGFAERFVNRSLAQVTRYLTEPELRAEVQGRVIGLIGPETKAVVGHSLGSVAAFQTAHRLRREVPLLLTLGSPLGMRSLVYDRLEERREAPAKIRRWVNLADRDDLVAATPDLSGLFADPGGVLHCDWTLDNGARPHEATSYLTKRQAGRALGDSLSG
jgi:hypothetical protein